MTHEIPTPFLIPEIIRDPDCPPMYMDLEFHPSGLDLLMREISHRNRPTPNLHQIIITGGFKEKVSVNISIPQQELVFSTNPTIENLPEVFYAIFESLDPDMGPDMRNELVFGRYHPPTKCLSIYTDTLTLAGITYIVDTVEKTDYDFSNDLFHEAFMAGTSMLSRRALIHEIVHSSQKGVQRMHKASRFIPRPLHRSLKDHYHSQAMALETDPELEQKAEQALSLRPLISNDELIDLYHLAHERYHLLQEKEGNTSI